MLDFSNPVMQREFARADDEQAYVLLAALEGASEESLRRIVATRRRWARNRMLQRRRATPEYLAKQRKRGATWRERKELEEARADLFGYRTGEEG